MGRSAVTTRITQGSLCSTVRAEVPGSRTGWWGMGEMGQNLFQVSIIATGSITTFFQQGPKSFQERQKLLTMTFREASLFPFSPVMDLGYGRVTSPCGLWFPHS